MNIQSSSVTIAEELLHIENYLKMQDLRFPHSVTYTIHCPDDVGRVEIPFLMLSPWWKTPLNTPWTCISRCSFPSPASFGKRRASPDAGWLWRTTGTASPPKCWKNIKKSCRKASSPRKNTWIEQHPPHPEFTYHRQDLLRLSNREAGGARAEILVPIEEEEP